MLPCIYEGVPSQDSETLQQSAVNTLISRCGQKAIPLPHNGAAFSPLPDAQGLLACGLFPIEKQEPKGKVPIERQHPKGKGTFCLARGSFKDDSAFQSKGKFATQSKDASAFQSKGKSAVGCQGRAPISDSRSVSISASDRLCFCSDLQRYIQSHVLFPSLPASGKPAVPPHKLYPWSLFIFVISLYFLQYS